MRTAAESSTSSARQALFARFSHEALKLLEGLPQPTPLVLLTGGLRSPAHLHTALTSRHAHLLGIGRGSVLCPRLPEVLKERSRDDRTPFGRRCGLDKGRVWRMLPRIKLIGAGGEMG